MRSQNLTENLEKKNDFFSEKIYDDNNNIPSVNKWSYGLPNGKGAACQKEIVRHKLYV